MWEIILKKDHEKFKNAPKIIKNNLSLIKVAIQVNAYNIFFVPNKFKSDPLLWEIVIGKNPAYFMDAPSIIRNN